MVERFKRNQFDYRNSAAFFITQQGLSNAIKMLEKEYNETFLNRSNHGVTLTPAGKAFLASAEKVIAAYDELNANFALYDDTDQQLQDTVAIACHARLLDSFLLDIIESVTVSYPNIILKVLEADQKETIDMVHNGVADIGLSIRFLEQDEKSTELLDTATYETISCATLYTDFYVICCRKNHPLTKYDVLSYPQLSESNSPVVHFKSKQLYDQELVEINKNLFATSNTSFHKALIKRGMAVGLISSFEYRKLYQKHPYLTAVSLENSKQFQIQMYYRTDKQFSKATQKIFNLIRSYNFHTK